MKINESGCKDYKYEFWGSPGIKENAEGQDHKVFIPLAY